MKPDTRESKLRVLFVPDSAYWVTATIARQIALHNPWIEPTICSHRVLQALMDRGCHLADRIDVVHFLTPSIGTMFLTDFEARVPCVTAIYHVEDQRSVEPVPRSDAVMTISQQWHDHLVSIGVDPSKIARVTVGVETELFRPSQPAERAKLRARFGLPPEALVIGFSAKRTSDTYNRKGTDVLVDGLTALRQRLPHAACFIVGPGWSDIVARQVEKGGVCIHMPFILEREDLSAVYRCLDVYWVTARIEGGPVPLLEAMSSGVCCVTTPVGIAPELVRDGENAFLAPIDSTDTFIERTAALAADPGLRKRMSQAARQTIVASYRWEQTTQTARELYATAIQRFQLRLPGAVAPRLPEHDNFPAPRRIDELSAIPPNLKSWVSAMEHIAFTQDLHAMGESTAASRVAARAIRSRPWDRQIWRAAAPFSPLSKLYYGVRMLYRGLKASYRGARLQRTAGTVPVPSPTVSRREPE
jgi:glycosyltransferase involved in cell wall biosynthesis